MSQYLAITIGPIFDTLQQARKTRELWAASYLFSRLMEYLVEEVSGQLKARIFLPHKVSDTGRPRYGAGIYNDRLFASVDACDEVSVEKAINTALDRLSAEIAPGSASPNAGFWRQYLRIGWICKPLDAPTEGTLFTQMNRMLDAAELHTPFVQNDVGEQELTAFLTGIYKTPMAQKALPGKAKGTYEELLTNGLFPSTADLATYELFKKNKDAYKRLLDEANVDESQDMKQIEAFYEKLFTSDNPLKSSAREYHKYYCIVHADGDNLGSLNATLHTGEAYRDLSEKLSQFALDAAQIINDHGGKPVFIGGDDLLFFAPVCSVKDGKTVSVFQLIGALSREYERLNLGDPTHLSFGVTLSYYKFPLFEARQLSYDQLTYRAKKAKWSGDGEKNAVAFRLLKHSGAYFEGVFSKPVLEAFVRAENELRQGDLDLISGIVFKMDTLNGLIWQLEKDKQLDARLEPLFDNFFNESVHKNNRPQMSLVRALLQVVHQSGNPLKNKDEAAENRENNLYAILRLLKFVTDRGERTGAPGARELQVATPSI